MRHFTSMAALCAVAACLGLPASQARALSVDVISNPGDTIIQANNGAIGDIATELTPHGAWQTPDPFGRGAFWISGGAHELNDPAAPAFTYRETFDLSGESSGHMLRFWVWADDTASVTLDGFKLFDENLTQDTCASGSIGCEPDEGQFSELALLAGAIHTLDIAVFQTGRGPMGVLLSGDVNPVPLPAALPLFAAALAGLGLIGWKRRHRV